MEKNVSNDIDIIAGTDTTTIDDGNLPKFSFPSLKDDPDLQFQFNTYDEDAVNYVNTYLDEAISSNLEKLEFKWKCECLICVERFEDYQDLLAHCKLCHNNEFNEYACTLQDCDVVNSNEKLLARHLVLNHSDLQSLKIYGSCPYCGLRFSNFTELNKHSCYSKLTRKAGMRPYCEYCKEEFVSHKRLLFHLQFHLAKRRSKICLICNKDFIDVDEFFEHVNYGHEPPERLACTICDRIFKENAPFKAHQEKHKQRQKFSCDECSRTYHIKRSLQKHKIDFHSKSDYKCDLCTKTFTTISSFETHMKWHNPDAEVQVYTCSQCGMIGRDYESLQQHIADATSDCLHGNIEEEILTAAYTCLYCARDFKSKASLRNHVETGVHENGKFTCPLCNDELPDYKAKRMHMKTHKNYRTWLACLPLKRFLTCDVGDCEESYSEWPALQRHKSRQHNPNTCAKCNRTLSTAAEYETHVERCQSTANFVCQFCDKICPTKMSLAVHVARKHNTKHVSCPQCSSSYKDEQALQEHINNTHLALPCTLCNKVMNSKRNLETHMRLVHQNECRFFCAHCNKGFFHRSLKEVHEETTHTGAVYKCGSCKFTTKYPKSLEIHMAKHLKKLEFKCPYCDSEFGRKQALEMHIKRHKNYKPFRCSDCIVDGCDATFIAQYLLDRHIEAKHSTKAFKRKTNAQKPGHRVKVQPKSLKRKNPTSSAIAIMDAEIRAECSAISTTATSVDGILLEVNETNSAAAAAATVDNICNSNDADVQTLPNDPHDKYMLLVVDDDAMRMVTSSHGQYIMLDETELLQVE